MKARGLKLRKDWIWEPAKNFGSYAFRREIVMRFRINKNWTYAAG